MDGYETNGEFYFNGSRHRAARHEPNGWALYYLSDESGTGLHYERLGWVDAQEKAIEWLDGSHPDYPTPLRVEIAPLTNP